MDLALEHGVSRTIRKLLRRAGCALRTHARACELCEVHNHPRRPPPERVGHRDHVEDLFGALWRVTHAEATEHGFELLRGVRVGTKGSPAVIQTSALAEHLVRHRLAPRLLALPLGESAIGRLRRRLDQDWTRENRAWWEERRGDLERLSPAEFAARHGV